MRQREMRGLDEVWNLKQEVDRSFWWICDLVVLDGWVIQVSPSRVIDCLIIFLIIQKRRVHD
jgi:hypothetical protein